MRVNDVDAYNAVTYDNGANYACAYNCNGRYQDANHSHVNHEDAYYENAMVGLRWCLASDRSGMS